MISFYEAYCVEITLKIIGLGPHNYYRKPWNVWVNLWLSTLVQYNHLHIIIMPFRIDTLIVLVSLICLLLEVDSKLAFLALVRPIKLLRYSSLSALSLSLSLPLSQTLPLSPPPFLSSCMTQTFTSSHTYCRLLRLKRRYRDIMSTIVYLAPKMLIVAVFLGIVYYFFAIIGVEFLSGKVFKGCW